MVPTTSLIDIPSIHIPDISVFSRAIIHGTLPQFFLSVGNAVLAISLLFKDLLNKKVDPNSISKSTGVMCLSSSLLGGFFMCHGSGGFEGQYRFGARTGGSDIILGSVYLGLALISGAPNFFDFFSFALLGALLIFISL